MNVIFKTNDTNVMQFTLNIEKKQVEEIKIFEGQEGMVKIYFPNGMKIEGKKAQYKHLEDLLKYYLDADEKDISLEEILKHIEFYGFYTPYKHNLRIEINRN